MAKYTVSEGQTLVDVAVIGCGSASVARAVAKLNNLSVTEVLTPGQVLELPDPVKKDYVDYYRNKALRPATQSKFDADLPRVFGDEFGDEFE